MPRDEFGRVAELPQRGAGAELALDGGHRVDETADAADRLVDLAAHVSESVGHLVCAGGQSVEVAGTSGDQIRRSFELIADLACLVRRPGLFE